MWQKIIILSCICISPFLCFLTIALLSKIGWGNVGILFSVWVVLMLVWMRYNEKKTKQIIKDEYADNDWITQELNRPIVKKYLDEKYQEPVDTELYPKEINLDSIITGKVTWRDKNGKEKDLFNINVDLKIK